MQSDDKVNLRHFIRELLENSGDKAEFADDEYLFSSGRLDSFNMMQLVMYLEKNHQIDFGNIEFDVAIVDSINLIETLVDRVASSN